VVIEFAAANQRQEPRRVIDFRRQSEPFGWQPPVYQIELRICPLDLTRISTKARS
jgi:hypothetical protein